MLRKDKRSMLLSLVIGDGCLHYHKRGPKTYGGITIAHSTHQADYIAWKAQLIGNILGREIRLRKTSNSKGFGNEGAELIQIAASWKRFKAWRKFVYPKGKKDKSKILKFIVNPEFLIAVWLMDDGYVEGKIDRKYGKCYNANLRLFISDQNPDQCSKIQDWIKNKFGFITVLKMQKTRNKEYPFLKINSADSLILWDKIREFVLQFKSMHHKFRFLEMRYQYKKSLAQHTSKE
jgi:hypothetical protein